MSITFRTNQVGANFEYSQYVSGPVKKTDKVNAPDLLDFSLVNFDGNMVKLQRGTHIVVVTTTYGLWFSGYITNDPEPVYLGTNLGLPVWQYNYEATSEDYILNLKPFGIMQPFTNTTQGAIIKALIAHLSPQGVTFDVSGVQDGQQVPRFIVDPNQHFYDVVDAFAKSAHYVFRCSEFSVTYEQQDSTVPRIAVDGNSEHFTPSGLQLKAAGDPIINDSIVLGAIEPQNYMEEFFMGDGATATFPLISSVFGVDSTLLIDDDLSSNTIDNSKWTVYDTNAGYLQPYGGTLNVLGGNNTNSLDVSLQSANLIPLEGSLRCTHGEWDFVSQSDGVLGGLWTGQTNGSMTGLVYGIRALPSGGSGTVLHPIQGSTVDSTQSATIDYSKRYVMRTLYSFGEAKRYTPTASYRDQAGVIHSVSIPSSSDHFYATTVITELDPITAVTTNQWTWVSDLSAQSASYAYYVPVASNNLNLTVCSVTVSVPMQAVLNSKPAGATTWNMELLGPNEVDSLDGLAPAATIVDSNNGAQTRSSMLGSANYNPGQATLTYFKNSTQLVSYLPNPGDLVRLSYRQAGAAIGRAQSKTSIAAEAAAWGDDGVRSETKRDLNPLPMTSAECELAAVARVNDNCYQHWSGTYSLPSGPWFTGEPVAGTILPFQNLPPQFPSILQAEEITQVESTLVAENPTEVINHVITFGPTSSIENVLAAVKNTNGVFTPQDTAEIPQFIDVSTLGLTTVPPVPRFEYTGQDFYYWHFKFVDALPSPLNGIGVEIRYTDTGWGADDGNNLIGRITTNHAVSTGSVVVGTSGGLVTFSIPRTVRGKVAFMRCYDKRNVILYSEDLTQSAWVKNGGTAVEQVMVKNPDGDYSMISWVGFANAGDSITQTTGVEAEWPSAEFSVSVLGILGSHFNVTISEAGSFAATTTFACTGKWQRVTVPYLVSPLSHSNFRVSITPVSTPQTLYITRASMEINVLAESLYCKTSGAPYGALSRFSTGVHTALPLVPPSPTARGNFTFVDKPVISAVLPANLTDVWGCEIRAADNATVLFKTDLVNATLSVPTLTGDTSMELQVTAPALTKREYSYWLYTYNLFGEYSTGYNFIGTLDPPSVGIITVLNSEKMLMWTGAHATSYKVYVDTVDTTLTNLSVDAATINTFYPLEDSDFYGLRYMAITPYDAIGPGVTMGAWFEYLPGPGGWPPAATVSNPSFETGTTTGWSLAANWSLTEGHACFGDWSVYIAGSPTTTFPTSQYTESTTHVSVTPGNTYYGQCMVDVSQAAGTDWCAVYLAFHNSSGTQLAVSNGTLIPFGYPGWNLSYVQATAPAGAAYVVVGVTVQNQTAGTVYADDFDVNVVPAALTVPSGAVYVKLANVGPDHNIHISTALNPQGSILPNQPIDLSYTTTDTQIVLTLGATSLLRADGSTLSIPSGSATYSSLTQTTTYYFYPYVDSVTGALGFANPNPPSTTPNVTQSMQTSLDGRIAATFFNVTTLATPGGGGSPPPSGGGAGGGGRCPEENEMVDVQGKGQVKVGDVVAGDYVRGWSFRESVDVYRRVVQTTEVPCASWYVIDGYKCSPTEPVYYNNNWMVAFRVPGATFDTTVSRKVKLNVETDEYDEQNYYLTTGTTPLLIHNYIQLPC